jgi:superfamily II DNA or RNA helicase
MSKVIFLLRTGNLLIAEQLPEELVTAFKREFSFVEDIFLRGREAYQAKREGRSLVQQKHHVLWSRDYQNRLMFPFGFWHRATRCAQRFGYTVRIEDQTPVVADRHAKAFEPEWDRLADFDLRYGQREILEQLLKHPVGRIDVPPGVGKTYLLGALARLLPYARIDISTPGLPVLKNIYDEVRSFVGGVGLVGGGKRELKARVRVISADSLNLAEGRADIFLADEAHRFGADRFSTYASKYRLSRCFGLSGSFGQRRDGKDMRVEALFGPIIYQMKWAEAVRHQLIVPVKVEWSSVILDVNPCAAFTDTKRERWGIWRNRERNRLIAADATQYSDEEQVLVVCRTVEHAAYLKKQLPQFTLVHAAGGMSDKDRDYYIRHDLISPSEPVMTTERLENIQNAFRRGTLKKVIANSVWDAGVNFPNLAVLIRADAGGGGVRDTQIPGRTSRLGKEYSIVHDYLDQFDERYRNRAKTRFKNYGNHGWEQFSPDEAGRALLRRWRSR